MDSSTVIDVPSLDSFPFAIALRDNPTLYGSVEAVHLVGMALLVGSVIAFDLRILGVGRQADIRGLARHLLPIALGALVLVVPSGLALFAANATALLSNSAFTTKIVLLFVHGALAIAFHAGPYRHVETWTSPPPSAKAIAFASLAGWIAVIVLASFLSLP